VGASLHRRLLFACLLDGDKSQHQAALVGRELVEACHAPQSWSAIITTSTITVATTSATTHGARPGSGFTLVRHEMVGDVLTCPSLKNVI